MSLPKTHQTGTPGSTHALGCYYVNFVSGTIQRQCNPVLASLLAGAGFFGTSWTPATATNAFSTFEAAQKFAQDAAVARHAAGVGLEGGSPGIVGGGVGSGATPAPGAGSGSGSSGQSDWTHLAIRLAEFGIGIVLVIIGFNAIVAKTKTGQKIQMVATGVATKVPK